MKIAIIGSRVFKDYRRFKREIDKILTCKSDNEQIISGGAQGTDSMAKRYALKYNLKFIEIKPDYNQYGRNATLIRNKEIVNQSDYVIAFWDGKSKGTGHVISYCYQVNTKCIIIKI